ncbi:hypothetical protein EVAR_102192_1 [Eumeta japonica]|uniref:Uncharacterized protein n=1 Tax=Eumeta variegata TaxID=151549 RepID=A0A4C1T8H1_EUMVA|nr:hypothetical protein EVAR_102192_1 [Eumeta japonica]
MRQVTVFVFTHNLVSHSFPCYSPHVSSIPCGQERVHTSSLRYYKYASRYPESLVKTWRIEALLSAAFQVYTCNFITRDDLLLCSGSF